MATASELNIQENASAINMAREIFGEGTTVTGASYSGDYWASGIYTNGTSVMGDVAPSNRGVILSTGEARDVTNSSGDPNRSGSTSTNHNNNSQNGLADFDAIAGNNTYDAAFLDIDFTPQVGVSYMSMQFVFASDEYPEYANSIYNDVVGVWINGTHVPLAVGSGQTSVTNVNQNENINLYNDNTGDQFNTEMDGFTVTMTLTIPVIGGASNSIRIGIADASDGQYDSNLFIAANSLQTDYIAIQDSETVMLGQTKTIDVLGNDQNQSGGSLTVTHINGQAISPGDSVTLTDGQVVTLNADGTLGYTATLTVDTVNFTYSAENSDGTSDTGFVTVGTIPCFVAGTHISTPEGERRVETLEIGDLVNTHDNGPQPLRWIGQRRVEATGNFAPIQIKAGTFGDHGTLMVSPQHRVLVADVAATLWFGEDEVLVAAKDLVNDLTIRPVEGGMVDYVHLLFDTHQVIYSEGLATESFFPGPMTLSGFEADIVQELTTLFPELDPTTGNGYGRAARPMLKGFETQVLLAPAVY